MKRIMSILGVTLFCAAVYGMNGDDPSRSVQEQKLAITLLEEPQQEITTRKTELLEPAKKQARIESEAVVSQPTALSNPHLNEALFSAIKNGKTSTLHALLEEGAHVNACDENGSTALHEAATQADLDMCVLLLKRDAMLNATDKAFRTTPLHKAVKGGHSGICKLFLEKGALVNASDMYGRTPLHYAVYYEQRYILQLLIGAGAEVNAQDDFGRTPLSLIAEKRTNIADWQIAMEYLLKQGALVDLADAKERTPLRKTISCKKTVYNQASAACQAAHQEDIQDDEEYEQQYRETGSLELCQTLIPHRANVNTRDKKGTTPLHKAAQLSGFMMCRLLLQNGAKFYRDQQGDTPLHLSSQLDRNNSRVIKLFEVCKAPFELQNKKGATALHKAATSPDFATFSSFLAAGAQVNAIDYSAQTPLHYALERLNDLESDNAEDEEKRTAQNICKALVLKGAFVFPFLVNRGFLNTKNIMAALCALRRYGVPKDIVYTILTSDFDLAYSLKAMFYHHMVNNFPGEPLRAIPTQFKQLMCRDIHESTLKLLHDYFVTEEESNSREEDGENGAIQAVEDAVEEIQDPFERILGGDETYYLAIASQLGFFENSESEPAQKEGKHARAQGKKVPVKIVRELIRATHTLEEMDALTAAMQRVDQGKTEQIELQS